MTAQQVGQQVFKTLERAIVECTLEPGAVLSDRQLAVELEVSRTPVRDALRLLESTGLVERRGRVGWAVTRVDIRDVEELFELRCLLEPAGLSRIVRWDDGRLDAVIRMFDGFGTEMDTDDIARYLHVDDAFHDAIVAASENRRLSHIYQVLSRELSRFRHFTSYRYEGRVAQSLGEHRTICAALSRRDADAAAESLVAHIVSAKAALITTVQDSVVSPRTRTPNSKELA
ncbi:GntR family transcriptional regulator [Pseudonocardia sichuanensis]